MIQDNSEDNRNNEIIYISDNEPMFSSRNNETSDIMQVEIDELPQSMNSLTFKEFASIRYKEPASKEPEFETDESKSKSDETETKSESKSDKTENESEESEKSELAEEEFPNNTYADLMTLVIQHNLNNKAGNAIIRFFNKHSNLLTSPLPKNIEQIEIDELPQSMNSLTFKEFASIRYKEPASKEPEFETDESKSKSDETETKSESKSDKTENESEESEKSELAEEEFPNNTYADLMTLVIQHNLNNKAGNAIIRFFNKHSNLLTSPLPKNIEQNIYKYIIFNFKNDQTNNNRNYNEQYTSNWWARTEKTLPTGSYLLSIILYSDASTTNSLGKNTLHPIFVTLGNIITWRRNKPDVKQLLTYLPIIKAKDDTQKISEEHKNIVRRTFHKSLKFLLSPLYDNNGIELELNNSIFWCFPRISMIISDWPKACTFALTYKSTKSNYPCHFCLVSKEDLSNINLNSNQIEPRSHNNMKLYYKNNTGKNVSIENVRNFFWNVPNINIYAAIVFNRMHHLDLGLSNIN
ncbi:hypothetical protein Glove_262g2 [Diversispora epigaea]|uniref:Uncharacterized protein n=1 Tax=Diversispora epigaea TaxID=1348612 RepID=A0A397IE79_9GLOM|nr:hypothetical protein Glove_262g2 [Diversispora epigaea]